MAVRKRVLRMASMALVAVTVATSAVAVQPAEAGHRARVSKAPVMWEWDDETIVGRSLLVRTPRGLGALLRTSGLTPGDAVTLWVAVFNNPAACSTTPCARPADVQNPDTRTDLFWVDGAVVRPDGTAWFGGIVRVGQVEHSLKGEVGVVDPVPLEDPFGAEVALALHSHGPAQTGDLLEEQLTTFLGGCDVLVGIEGFAQGPEDLPDEVGECTTFQKSVHLP